MSKSYLTHPPPFPPSNTLLWKGNGPNHLHHILAAGGHYLYIRVGMVFPTPSSSALLPITLTPDRLNSAVDARFNIGTSFVLRLSPGRHMPSAIWRPKFFVESSFSSSSFSIIYLGQKYFSQALRTYVENPFSQSTVT